MKVSFRSRPIPGCGLPAAAPRLRRPLRGALRLRGLRGRAAATAGVGEAVPLGGLPSWRWAFILVVDAGRRPRTCRLAVWATGACRATGASLIPGSVGKYLRAHPLGPERW